MEISLNITEDIKLGINEELNELIKRLEDAEIRYKILYDKVNESSGIKETVMYIDEFGTELHLVDNKICYISSYNNKYTNIIDKDTEDIKPIKFVNIVKDKINKLVEHEVKIDIEKIDLGTMNCRFVIHGEKGKYKINLSRDGHGNVYIHTLRAVQTS